MVAELFDNYLTFQWERPIVNNALALFILAFCSWGFYAVEPGLIKMICALYAGFFWLIWSPQKMRPSLRK